MTVQAPEQSALPGALTAAVLPLRQSRSRLANWLRRRDLDLWIPGVILAALLVGCFILPLTGVLPNPAAGDLTETLRPPLSPGHILGTDTIGRDVMSRVLFGGRTSLEVGVSVNVIGIVVGGLIGMFSGFRRGVVDSLIMRILDVMLAFPALILTIVIATYLGPSELNVIWAISFFSIPAYARLARAVTLKMRERVYIDAARMSGRGDGAILLRHIAPNVLPQLATFSLLQVGIVVMIEATLSFLGAGVGPQEASWGTMIATGQIYLSTNPALVLVPSAFLFVTVVCLNVLGDGLRSRYGRAL
ncbi:MAG TPA: ABC transporter permease [Streptosporangiaceae bacterium]